jgi:hypothetical protein
MFADDIEHSTAARSFRGQDTATRRQNSGAKGERGRSIQKRDGGRVEVVRTVSRRDNVDVRTINGGMGMGESV